MTNSDSLGFILEFECKVAGTLKKRRVILDIRNYKKRAQARQKALAILRKEIKELKIVIRNPKMIWEDDLSDFLDATIDAAMFED